MTNEEYKQLESLLDKLQGHLGHKYCIVPNVVHFGYYIAIYDENGNVKKAETWTDIKSVCDRLLLESITDKKPTRFQRFRGWLSKKFKAIKRLFSPRKIVYAEDNNGVLTVKWDDGMIDYFREIDMLWYKLPTNKTCGTVLNLNLWEVWKYCHKYKGSYPNAHKTQVQ